jgi:hypothetical protein
VHGLVWLQLRLLAWQPAHGFGDLHPFSGAQPDLIGLELRNHRDHVDEQPSDGIDGVGNRAAEAELDVSVGQLIEDVAGSCSERASRSSFVTTKVSPTRQAATPAKTWPVAVRARRAVVEVDAVVVDPERVPPVALGGQILLLC